MKMLPHKSAKYIKIALGFIFLLVVILVINFLSTTKNILDTDKSSKTNINKQQAKELKASDIGVDYLVYTNPNIGFNFHYSLDSSIGIEQYEDGSQNILVQNKTKGTIGQIFVSSFPNNVELTAELISKEFPEKKIISGKKILIGGVVGFSFESQEEGVGKTWEVVFAKDGNIYQTMSLLKDREDFEKILTTWEF